MEELVLDPAHESVLIPALEVPAINLTIWGFNRYVLDADYARISPQSIGRNITGGWTFDSDSFEVNQFGHPYQGALSFTAARSAGVGFWWSILFPYFGSLMWELAMETDPPSVNDQITTPLAGVFLGEALHRLSTLVLRERGDVLGEVVATVLNPMRALNRHAFGLRGGFDEPALSYVGQLSAGLTVTGTVTDAHGIVEGFDRVRRRVTLGARLLHGLPKDERLRPHVPFEHFSANVELNLSSRPFAQVSVQGLVWGGRWGGGDGWRGLGGLFAGYDFSNPRPFRVSTVSVGPGATMAWTVAAEVPVLLTMTSGFVPMGAAGLSTSEALERDYHIGPGHLASASLAAVLPGVGWASATARHTTLRGVRGQPGWENITRLELHAELRVAGCQGVGVSWAWNRRRAGFEEQRPDLEHGGALLRAYWTWVVGGLSGRSCREA